MTQMLQLLEGRVFCRTSKGTGFVGLIEMPAYLETESLRSFRMDTHIWVDVQNVQPTAPKITVLHFTKAKD